jgi:O-acetyl-ADP-ribose deacetylase (regulator of RNase III)
MIRFSKGNIFEAQTDAIVNTVNLVGVMGKGLALQFKERFKNNFLIYKQACSNRTIGIGNSLVVAEQWLGKPILIINFPTKVHWRNPSEYSYIEQGLDNLRQLITRYNVQSIAIPPLGAGNGGLDWNIVKQMISAKLSDINCDIVVFEPGYSAVSTTGSAKLTPARALLVYMLRKMQCEGFDATAFAAVKLIYFMQRFGARDIFKLDFQPYIYGPYCDKVRHLLHAIDGTFIRGFADMSKRPFEPFDTNHNRLHEVNEMVEQDPTLSAIAKRTCDFLNDNWDDFSLELLSTVDYLMMQNPAASVDEIYNRLCAWNDRKKRIFADKRLTESAYHHILSV